VFSGLIELVGGSSRLERILIGLLVFWWVYEGPSELVGVLGGSSRL
jgi:hypothetical protein